MTDQPDNVRTCSNVRTLSVQTFEQTEQSLEQPFEQPFEHLGVKALAARVLGGCRSNNHSNNPSNNDQKPFEQTTPKTGDFVRTCSNTSSNIHPANKQAPSAPCPCGSGAYHLAEAGGPWTCSTCHPRTEIPVATIAVDGGYIPRGAKQDVDAAIRAAVTGLPLDADEFRAWLDPADLADIGRGVIPAETLRGYAVDLIRRGPLELGTTVGGVRVCSYTRDEAEAEPLPTTEKITISGGNQ